MVRPRNEGNSAPLRPADTAARPAGTYVRATTAVLVDHRRAGVVHLGGVAGMVWLVVHPSLPTLALPAAFYVACGLAITAGYHRLFAHRTYRAGAPVRWFFLVFGAATFQNSALSWSADHRAHHADTDGDSDPHSITRGAWFAHIGWLFRRREASADVTACPTCGRYAASACSTAGTRCSRSDRARRTRCRVAVARSHRWPAGRRLPPRRGAAASDVLRQLPRPSPRRRRFEPRSSARDSPSPRSSRSARGITASTTGSRSTSATASAGGTTTRASG